MAVWLGGARLGGASGGQLKNRRNRRWFWRKKLAVAVGEQEFCVRATDLSANGAGLLLPERLEIGSLISVYDGEGTPRVPACVVHVAGPDKHGLYLTGVRFVHEIQGGQAQSE